MYGRNEIAAHQNATVAPRLNGENQIGLDLPTGGYRGKRVHENPGHCSLGGLTEISRSLQGVELSTLAPFDTIAVRTVNSDYRIFLLDPETGRALLEGGGQITEPVEVIVIGSSFGGSSLRTGWIGVGLRMEACANDKYMRTSPVQSLSVEHQTSPELASSIAARAHCSVEVVRPRNTNGGNNHESQSGYSRN